MMDNEFTPHWDKYATHWSYQHAPDEWSVHLMHHRHQWHACWLSTNTNHSYWHVLEGVKTLKEAQATAHALYMMDPDKR